MTAINFTSIFDKIESIKSNPEIFCFKKCTDEIHYKPKEVLKEGHVFLWNIAKQEARKFRIVLTKKYLIKYSVN